MTPKHSGGVATVLRDFVVLLGLWIYYYIEALFRCFIRPPLKSLEGEVILITGGANGIGRHVSLLLSQCKATIVCWDIDSNANAAVVKELKALGCDAYAFKVDISDRSQVDVAAKELITKVGYPTILINNAGIMPCKGFFNHTPEELERVFKINVYGNFWTLRAFVPNMIAKDKGHIVTVCSAAGLIGSRNLVPYCGTKHAVHGIIEALKDEFNHMPKIPNINFTTVYPYSCNTGLLNGVKSHTRFPWLVPKVLRPEDVAGKIVEGLQRNYEQVYVPGFVQIAGSMARVLLPKVQIAAKNFVQCYVEPVKELM